MTADYIALHAAERPDVVALINGGRAITYAEFDRDLRKFTAAVCALGLPRGRRVAVGCDDFYTHWLLLLAFECLGIATLSFVAPMWEASNLPASVDLVLVEPHFRISASRPLHLITPDWVERARSAPDETAATRPPSSPDDHVRILFTSGTTGASKKMLVTRKHHETRVAQNALKYRFNETSRYLVTTPLAVGVVYSCVTACVRLGALVVADAFNDPRTMGRALQSHGITHTTLLPVQLQQMLDNLPADFEKPPALTIFTLGAAVSDALRQETLARLAANLCSGYGCNEVGIISFTSVRSPDNVETICPGVIVETLDEHGRALPPGEIGEIRVKTPCMADGYADDAETSRRMFRDGWFYPGDIGVMHGPRRLQVIGRADEILNVGGVKMSPSVLEDIILRRTPIRETGVCSTRNAAGIEEICVAIANSVGTDPEILDWITRAFHKYPIGIFRIVKLPTIPRNAAGKIQRDVLRQAAMDAVARGAPDR